MKKNSLIFLLFTQILFCQTRTVVSSKVQKYYSQHSGSTLPSKSKGTVGNGQLINGKLIPFSGTNYEYFSERSYLAGRAFLNDKVLDVLLRTYSNLANLLPNRLFYVMECANEQGGKLFPHRTHQNGLSVDFMMPLLKDGVPYYGLDTLGANHYFLEFDNDGKYKKDKSIKIDFNLVAKHILDLEKEGVKSGISVKKVIINIQLKDNLFATEYGRKLKRSRIYIVKRLSTLVNSLHDDHYHIDFIIKK